MKNPWLDLPQAPPYVLSADEAPLNAFNRGVQRHYFYDTSLLPEPYFGRFDAPVVVLNLNPGWSPEDAQVHAQPAFAKLCRSSLGHTLKPYPFLHLRPSATTPGAKWWRSRTRALSEEVGFDSVALNLACVQFMPYHSIKFSRKRHQFESQNYGFHLVKQAMKRGAEIIIMRGKDLWFAAIPELASYPRLHQASNPRSPYLSVGNLKSAYAIVCQRLQSGT